MADETRVEKLITGFKGIVDASGSTVQALEEVNAAVLKTGKGMDGVTGAVKNTGLALTSLSKGLGGITGAVPGIGILGGAFDGLSTVLGTVTAATDMLGETFKNTLRGMDEVSAVNRDLTASNFEMAAQFGQSIDVAREFTDFMLGSAEKLSSAEYGFQNFATDTRPMVEALSAQRLSFEKMNETIETSAGSYSMYTAGLLQAQSLGLSNAEYAKKMSDMILIQGMSTQEASGALSIYGDIASETGLTVSKIADSLGGLGDGFKKMGLDATFGESFLRGFAKSLDETGIGIENATELAASFGSRMAELSTNYGSAFVTAQRGGLDAGSGGALGAGIQMQAKLMDKNTDQAALGKDIAGAVRETIASFTGGDIVTVTEAAESGDSGKEQAYYAQTQLLKSMYGITDANEQARTLELLTQMADAETTGDTEAMAMIGDDIAKAVGLREETMSLEDKANAIATAQLSELALHTKMFGTLVAVLGKEMLVDPAASGLDTAMEAMGNFMADSESAIEPHLRAAREGGSAYESLTGESASNNIDFLRDPKQGLGSGTGGGFDYKKTLNVADEGLRAAIESLTRFLRGEPDPPKPDPQRGGGAGTVGATTK